MKIKILCVGKVKESYYRKQIEQLKKKISSYAQIEIVEVADEKTPDKASDTMQEKIKEIEGKRLLSHIRAEDYVFALCIEGTQLSTKKLQTKIKQLMQEQKQCIVFLIGGSLGLHKDVVKRANDKISFSAMTFPHQMMRVLLLEQIVTLVSTSV